MGNILRAAFSGCLITLAALLLNGCGGVAASNQGDTTDPTLSVTVAGNGTVISSPSGINCGSTCSASFHSGTAVALTAMPASGYDFTGWGGACSGTGRCSLTLNGNQSLTATFAVHHSGPAQVNATVNGTGTVTSSPAGINCPGTCSANFPAGTTVTLTPQAPEDGGWVFSGWSGACSGTNVCNLSATGTIAATATFVQEPLLQVGVTGNGTVTSSPAGIDCGTVCSAPFATSSTVTLTATAASGYTLSSWGGACSGTGACSVTMNGNEVVNATFNSGTGGASGCGSSGYGYNNQNGAITGVWLQSPEPGQNQSHVQVNAVAFGPATVTQWMVCLDDQVVYQTDKAASSISQGIDIPAGQHLLYARAWDAQGDSNRSEVKLIQVGPPPPSSTVLPTPPANAQVLTEMQNDTAHWSICSLCAHGTNTTGNYWMAPFQTQPSLSGSSLEMFASGPSWTNVLFVDTMLGTSSNSHFLWDFWVYHDPAAEAHFWASEFDLWQVLGGSEFMIGSQCDFGDGYWSTWDSQGDRWVLNGIPCPHWTAGWHHIQWYFERLNATQYRYDTLVFDGNAYGLNQTWTVNSTTWPDMIGIQFQLDQDPTGTPLHEWVDHVTLTMW